MSFRTGTETIVCTSCDANHSVGYTIYPGREKGSNNCQSCGELLHKWNGGHDYDEPVLLKST